MPGFVIHLSIANKYIQKNYIDNKEKFFEGVLAPDFTKDKTKTHYGKGSSEVNLQEFLLKNDIKTSYNKGLFLHLITDYLFYNKFLQSFSKDIYNDYDILNEFLIKKYDIILPLEAKKVVSFKNGKLSLLDKESIIKFIDKVAEIDLLQAEKEIKENIPKGKWNTYNRKIFNK